MIDHPPPPVVYATWYANPRPSGAASRDYPRGTKLRIHLIHPTKRASVDVKINDYGPELWTGRHLDLSRESFARLMGLHHGVIQVRVEVLR